MSLETPRARSLQKDVLPIFRCGVSDALSPIEHCGTGFLVDEAALLTCWHCVRARLGDSERYAAALWTGNHYELHELRDIRQSHTGHDLALAHVSLTPEVGLQRTTVAPDLGTDVMTFGYPYTAVDRTPGGELTFELQGRYLQGYITRSFIYRQAAGFPHTPSYELDMPAPAGLSGAPLILVGSPGTVVGMVYGSHDVQTIAEMARVDPETGERTAEVVRLASFGLSHHNSTIAAALAHWRAATDDP